LKSRFTLQRHERLKSRKLTELLFKEGRSFNHFPYRAVYLFLPEDFVVPPGKAFGAGVPVQMAVGVSTKHFKKAVERNRIKRLTREAWRLQKNSLYETAKTNGKQLAVFLIFTGKELPPYDQVMQWIKELIHRLEKNIPAPSL
jgi:ribonuclease P protein component